MTGAHGAFVVSCIPLIRREAKRLARSGVPIEIEDAVQSVVLWLLEHEEIGAEHVALVVKRRLVDQVVRHGSAEQRARSRSRAADVPGALLTPSHEDEIVDRVTAEQLVALMPASRGARQSRDCVKRRWATRVRAFAMRGAA